MLRRFEGRERGKRRFYEIEVDGRRVTTTTGLLEGKRTPVTTTKEEWASVEDAKTELERFIKRKLKAGFEELKAPPKKPKKAVFGRIDDHVFADAILADRTDPTPWLVYADALQAVGDPRGELIVVQERRAREPKNGALLRAEDALMDANYEYFVGSMVVPHQEARALEVTWKNGFFETAWIGSTWSYSYLDYDDEDEGLDTFLVIGDLFDSPSARFLDTLTVESTAKLSDAADLVAECANRPPLRSLRFVWKGRRKRYERFDANDILAAFPSLRELAIDGHVEALDDTRLELESLTVKAPLPSMLESLTSKPWPNLRRLVLGTAYVREDTLASIIAGKTFPNLEHLGLQQLRSSDAVAEALAKSPLYPRLKSLDLSRGTLTTRGVSALAAGKRKSMLRSIEAPRNHLDKRAVEALATLAEKVLAASQRK